MEFCLTARQDDLPWQLKYASVNIGFSLLISDPWTWPRHHRSCWVYYILFETVCWSMAENTLDELMLCRSYRVTRPIWRSLFITTAEIHHRFWSKVQISRIQLWTRWVADIWRKDWALSLRLGHRLRSSHRLASATILQYSDPHWHFWNFPW